MGVSVMLLASLNREAKYSLIFAKLQDGQIAYLSLQVGSWFSASTEMYLPEKTE